MRAITRSTSTATSTATPTRTDRTPRTLRFKQIRPSGCVDLGEKAYRLCLPQRRVCDLERMDGLLANVGDAWCSTCQVDSGYSIPYLKGDVIHVQTRFFDSYNADRTRPQSAIGSFVRAYVTDGNVRQEITRGMAAWGCGQSFQVVEVDTATINLDCWVVELNAHNADGSLRRTIQTQEFGRITEHQAASTFTVRGVGRGQDCFGNCYDEPEAFAGDEIEYNNTLRFWGNLKDVGGEFEREELSGGYFSQDSVEHWRVSLSRKIPPFAKDLLLKSYLPAPELYLNGEKFRVDSFTVDNDIRRGTMFLFGVDLKRSCKAGECG